MKYYKCKVKNQKYWFSVIVSIEESYTSGNVLATKIHGTQINFGGRSGSRIHPPSASVFSVPYSQLTYLPNIEKTNPEYFL